MLTTPVDEDAFPNQGIHERLEIAEGYFGTDDIQCGVMKEALEADTKTLDKLKVERCTVVLSQSECVSSQKDG